MKRSREGQDDGKAALQEQNKWAVFIYQHKQKTYQCTGAGGTTTYMKQGAQHKQQWLSTGHRKTYKGV